MKLGYFNDAGEYIAPPELSYIRKCNRTKRNHPSPHSIRYFLINLCQHENGVFRYYRHFCWPSPKMRGQGLRKFKKISCRPLRCKNVRLQHFLFPNF